MRRPVVISLVNRPWYAGADTGFFQVGGGTTPGFAPTRVKIQQLSFKF